MSSNTAPAAATGPSAPPPPINVLLDRLAVLRETRARAGAAQEERADAAFAAIAAAFKDFAAGLPPGSVEIGRLIASCDALQTSKDIVFAALALPGAAKRAAPAPADGEPPAKK